MELGDGCSAKALSVCGPTDTTRSRADCKRDLMPLRRMKSLETKPPGHRRAAGKREKQKVEGRWAVGAGPERPALPQTDGPQQEWEWLALALRGVPGNVIKHSADPLAMGIWAPAHPHPPASKADRLLLGEASSLVGQTCGHELIFHQSHPWSSCPRLV